MKFSTTFLTLLFILAPLQAALPQAAVVNRESSGVVVDPSGYTCYVWRHNGFVGQAGTGTCIACEDGVSLVITNAHVVEGTDAPITILQGSVSRSGTLLAVARGHGVSGPDLALITVEGYMTPAPIADKAPSVNDRIRMWGYGGTTFVRTKDRQNAIYPVMKSGYYVTPWGGDANASMSTISGDSGSGWFNDAGELVGVHWGNNGQAWAVPLQSVRTFVRSRIEGRFPRLRAALSGAKRAVGSLFASSQLPQAVEAPEPKKSLPVAAKEPEAPKTNPSTPLTGTAPGGACAGGKCESPPSRSTWGTPARRGIFRR